ncbi:MAG TPA: hypothetical protein VNP72_09185 [Longimicrobium sp.]|nr:hypothetical protein [Longimicrobium sp.]
MRTSSSFRLALFACLAAAPAAAQPDSLLLRGVPVDAVNVPGRGIMTRCRHIESTVVVRTPEDAARISAHVWCAGGIESLPDSTLIGVRMGGDCHARYRLKVMKSDHERRYYVIATVIYGGCRAGGSAYLWIAVPSIPPDWDIVVRPRRVDRRDYTDDELVLAPER